MKTLVNRIATFFHVSSPDSRKRLGKLAERVILVILIGLGISTVLWAVIDKPCYNNCGANVHSPSSTHYGTCSRCGDGVWLCPNLDHPHKSNCDTCGEKYWNCPGQSEVLLHGVFCQFSGENSQKNRYFHPSDEKRLDR